jgi:hypothetical protein
LVSEIRVVCDDTGHARGRIAKIATVVRGPDGWDVLVPGRPVRMLATMYVVDGTVRRRDRIDLGPCKLCRRHWQRGRAHANAIFDRFAERGVSRVSLEDLAAADGLLS